MIVSEAAVEQGFAEAFVGVFELDIFADDGDANFAGGIVHAVDEVKPGAHVGWAVFQFHVAQDLGVEAFAAEFDRDGVNRVDIFHGNDAGFSDVAEERDFFLEVGGNVAIAAAKQNVGLDTDAEHFLDAVLRGLGF